MEGRRSPPNRRRIAAAINSISPPPMSPIKPMGSVFMVKGRIAEFGK
jgi:hypothetical protein